MTHQEEGNMENFKWSSFFSLLFLLGVHLALTKRQTNRPTTPVGNKIAQKQKIVAPPKKKESG
jgi:hypothetical protein